MEKKQILVLLPEISMTTQWLDRFKKKFKANPLLWHSDIKGSEKIKIWKSILEDNVNIVVGARSSLFLPFKNLGLIIIDEEHDQSFKQEEGIIYNARDMAVVRAKISNIPIILCSATLSIETKLNILEKNWEEVNISIKNINKYTNANTTSLKLIKSRIFLYKAMEEHNTENSDIEFKDINTSLKFDPSTKGLSARPSLFNRAVLSLSRLSFEI